MEGGGVLVLVVLLSCSCATPLGRSIGGVGGVSGYRAHKSFALRAPRFFRRPSSSFKAKTFG